MKTTRTIGALVALITTAILYGVVGVIFAATGSMIWVRDVYGPSLEYKGKIGRKHLQKNCLPTTDNLQDLIVTQETTHEQAADIAVEHGAAVVPSILTKETAQEFRDYVMKANKELLLQGKEQVYVHQKEHRFNLVPDPREPIVQEVLKQVAEHEKLRPLIDKLMGAGASLVNLSVLTSEYGAKDQGIHSDTSTSFATQPQHFVPEYSLVLALQDTTEAMGATHLCPGSQNCRCVAMEEGEDPNDEVDRATICKVRATLNQGDGFLFLSDLFHRGTAHTDPTAPERAYVFLIFAESRKGSHDHRILPFGEVRALSWHAWGHTIDDFVNVQSWKWWQSFGLGKKGTSVANVRPWNFVDNFFTMFHRKSGSIASISNDFDQEYFSALVDTAFYASFFLLTGLVYLVLLAALFVGCFYYVYSTDKTGLQNVGTGIIDIKADVPVPELVEETKKIR